MAKKKSIDPNKQEAREQNSYEVTTASRANCLLLVAVAGELAGGTRENSKKGTRRSNSQDELPE